MQKPWKLMSFKNNFVHSILYLASVCLINFTQIVFIALILWDFPNVAMNKYGCQWRFFSWKAVISSSFTDWKVLRVPRDGFTSLTKKLCIFKEKIRNNITFTELRYVFISQAFDGPNTPHNYHREHFVLGPPASLKVHVYTIHIKVTPGVGWAKVIALSCPILY